MPTYQSEENTAEHILECNRGDQKCNLKDKRVKESGERVEIYKFIDQ